MGNFKEFLFEYGVNDWVRSGSKQEKEVARTLRTISKEQNKDVKVPYTNTGIRGKESNHMIDVKFDVKTKDGEDIESGIEVKASDKSATVAHWNCKFVNDELIIDFQRVKDQNNVHDDDKSFQNMVYEIIKRQGVDENIKNLFDDLKDRFNKSANDLDKILNGKSKHLDSFYIDKDKIGNCYISKIEFPNSFKKILSLYEIYDEYHNSEYDFYKKSILQKIKNTDVSNDKYFSKLVQMLKQNVRNFDQNRFEDLMILLDSFYGEYGKFKDDDNGIKQDIDKIKSMCSSYMELLDIINEKRIYHKANKKRGAKKVDKLPTLGSLQNYEKIFYTCKKFLDVENHSDITPQSQGVVIASGKIERNDDKQLFDDILKKVNKYYSKYMVGDYIQIGSELLNLDAGETSKKYRDPLGIEDQLRDYTPGNVESIGYLLQFDTAKIGNDVNIGMTFYVKTILVKSDDQRKNPTKTLLNNTDSKDDDPTIGDNVAKLNESISENEGDGISTSETASDKFEVEVADKIREFFSKQTNPKYNSLQVSHYNEPDKKYWSDIKITNPNTSKNVWVEAKLNKYASLGSSSWKYNEGKWTCTTLQEDDPLLPLLKSSIEKEGQKFIDFCKEYLKKDDIKIPTDLTPELIDAWKKSGNITDTDNEVQFITNKIQIDDFGSKIAEFYKHAKEEPALYMQVADDLYIVDKNLNIFNFKTKDGKELKSLSEAYRIGRIQFRAKGLAKEQKYYYSVYADVKILADKENDDKEYSCSFLDEEKWPVIDEGGGDVKKDINEDDEELIQHINDVLDERKMDYRLKSKEKTYRPDKNNYAFKNSSEKYGGDDYITTDEIVERITPHMSSRGFGQDNWFKGPDKLDEKTSRIKINVNDGKDSLLNVKEIKHSDRYKDVVYVVPTNEDGMLTGDFSKKLLDITSPLGTIRKELLVYMNEEDESTYICNGMKAEGNDIVLDFEWGDALDFDKTLKESSDGLKFEENLSHDKIKNILDNSKIDNKRFSRDQFSKYFGLDNVNWCAISKDGQYLAIASIQNSTPFEGYHYIMEVQNFQKGYGKPLLEEIFKKYKKVWLMADVRAGEDLLNYYRGLKLEEFIIPNSTYGVPAYFYYTKDCEEDRLETYLTAFYSEDGEEGEIDESEGKRLKFKQYNANYFGKKGNGDCVIRALCIATGYGYKKICEMLGVDFVMGVGYGWADSHGISRKQLDDFAQKYGIIENVYSDEVFYEWLEKGSDGDEYIDPTEGYSLEDVVTHNFIPNNSQNRRLVILTRSNSVKERDKDFKFHCVPVDNHTKTFYDIDSNETAKYSIVTDVYRVKQDKVCPKDSPDCYENEYRSVLSQYHKEVDSALRKNGLDENGCEIDENLTIPENPEDKVEHELRKNLEKNYDHADRIIRWYRNQKKNGTDEKELKKTFVDNIDNIKDLFKTYERYVESMKRMKMLNKKVELNGKQFDVVKDVDKIRMLQGFRSLVNAIGDIVNSGTTIDTTNQKYSIQDSDRKNIRLIGFTENVMCWCTEGYETTNKFIYHLWQNAKTLGRGDVYGDPSEQTPYCTHSKEHWNDYSEGVYKYQQFWYLERFDNRMNASYDVMISRNRNGVESQDEIKAKDEEFKQKISGLKFEKGDLNNIEVIKIFNMMKGCGPSLIIAMNDSNNDFLDSSDDKFRNFDELNHGNEVEKLHKELFKKESKNVMVNLGGKEFNLERDERPLRVSSDDYDQDENSTFVGDFIPEEWNETEGVNTTEDLVTLKGLPKKMMGFIQIEGATNLKSLEGMPQELTGNIYINNCGIESLEYLPTLTPYPRDDVSPKITVLNTKIGNLVGAEKIPEAYHVNFMGSDITSLAGCPTKIKVLDLSNNEKLTSLSGISEEVKTLVLNGCNSLETLDYAPEYLLKLIMFPTEKITNEVIEEYKNYIYCDDSLVQLERNIKNLNDDAEKEKQIDRRYKIRMWHEIHTMPDGKHYRQNGPKWDDIDNMTIEELSDIMDKSGSVKDDVDEELETRIKSILEDDETCEAEKDIGGEKSDMSNEIKGKKIWIDDIREAPEGFIWFKTVREFIKYVDENGLKGVELIDTDHDAGDYQKYGGDYIKCFDYLDFIGAKDVTIHIHSANPVGANNIRSIISKNKEENNWKEVRNT